MSAHDPRAIFTARYELPRGSSSSSMTPPTSKKSGPALTPVARVMPSSLLHSTTPPHLRHLAQITRDTFPHDHGPIPFMYYPEIQHLPDNAKLPLNKIPLKQICTPIPNVPSGGTHSLPYRDKASAAAFALPRMYCTSMSYF